MRLRLLLSFINDVCHTATTARKGEQENGCILLLSFASVFINPTGINWEKSVKNMTLNFKSPQISHNRKLNKINEEKRWNVNVVEVVAAEEAEHTGTLLVRHLPLYTRINEAGKRKTEKRKKERGEKTNFSDLFMMQWRHVERIRTGSSGQTVKEDEVSS